MSRHTIRLGAINGGKVQLDEPSYLSHVVMQCLLKIGQNRNRFFVLGDQGFGAQMSDVLFV